MWTLKYSFRVHEYFYIDFRKLEQKKDLFQILG